MMSSETACNPQPTSRPFADASLRPGAECILKTDGEGNQSTRLVTEVYEELRRLATVRMAREAQGQTLQATALVHEAWLRLSAKGDQAWQNQGHFFAAAAEAMRRILIENARRKGRMRHGGGQDRVSAEVLDGAAESEREQHLLLIDEALKSLEQAHPDRARVVVLKFYGGLTNEDVAQALGIGERSVERHWACAKVWLLRWMEAAGAE